MKQIKIGVMAGGDQNTYKHIENLVKYGFESFQVNFWQTTGNTDLKELGKRTKEVCEKNNVIVSSLAVFGNPLNPVGDSADSLKSWERIIDNAGYFNAGIVAGFTGRIPGKPIEESLSEYKRVWGELSKRAKDKGIRIAFENCAMGGTWKTGDYNIAINPDAWELMFNEIPSDTIGLEWEPCHQMVQLIDPIAQLRKWAKKVFHVHGKDATVAYDVVKQSGVFGKYEFAWMRTPGFGDSNWTDIISILMQNGFTGTIDIEGWHDPVYREELEFTGQLHALKYLKTCRGGDFTPNL